MEILLLVFVHCPESLLIEWTRTEVHYCFATDWAGDPKRAAEILVRVVKRQHLPSHLLLGRGAVYLAQNYSRHQVAQAETWQQVSSSADFGQP